jgi:flavodoxin/NAD-dependent dihydropyrimidine dehydrogenase PreA subunit
MDVTEIFFSQTGNTRRVAKDIAEAFRADGHSVKTISLSDADPADVCDVDLLGFGSPCFSSKAPQPVMRFIRTLPPMVNQKAFVFATCGGAPGRVLYDIGNALRTKGANVLAGHLSRGEVHHPAPSINGRFPGRPNAEDFDQVRRFARAVSGHISTDHPVTLPGIYASSLKRRDGFYEFLGSVISDSTLRFFMPEPKVDVDKCDLCGWCNQGCPTQNIYLQPYPVLGTDCIRCYRCFNECPRNAFTTNWRFGDLILRLLYNQAFVRRFGVLEPGEKIY